jgi:hypothetical protein
MFRTESNVFAARVGRIAFGAYLTAGAILLLLDLADGRRGGTHAFELVVGSWLVALGMGYFVRKLVGARSAPRDAWLLTSLVLPGIGISLMMPLLVHLPIVAVLAGVSGFESWARTSFAIVGPSHLVLAALVVMRSYGLVRGSGFTPSIGHIYLGAVAVSLPNGAELLFIPTIIVALTGLTIVPLLRHMAEVVETERAVLPADPPRAVALVGRAA